MKKNKKIGIFNLSNILGSFVNLIANIFGSLFSLNVLIIPLFIILVISGVLVVVLFFLLSFKPLIPFKMENLYFERYLTKMNSTVVNDYKQYYYTQCNNIKLADYTTYTGKNIECKKPMVLFSKFYYNKVGQENSLKITNSYTDNQKNLINGLTTLSIIKSLNNIMIFKNFISGQYNITRITNNKMKLVLDNQDDIGNIYNPFNSIFGGSFILTGDIKGNNQRYNYILSKNGKIKIDKDRYFTNNVFFGTNEEKTELKLKNNDFKNVPIDKINNLSGYKDITVKAFISKNISNKERIKFNKRFNEKYGDIVYNYFNNIIEKYNNIDSEKMDNVPTKLTVCSDKPIKVPYFIKYLSNKEQKNGVSDITNIEKVPTSFFVCFTFNNIYKDKKIKQGFSNNLKIGQFIDSDIELNLYNMDEVYNYIKKTKNKIFINKFKDKYKQKIIDNIVSINIIKGYKFLTHSNILANYLYYNKEHIKSLIPSNLLYNLKSNEFNFYIEGCNKDNCNTEMDIYKSPFLYKNCNDGQINNCYKQNFTKMIGYKGAYMYENLFFNYLKILLLYNPKNKNIINNVDKGGQYIINYGNNRSTTLYNTYFSPLFNEFKEKYNNERQEDDGFDKIVNTFNYIISWGDSSNIDEYNSIYKYTNYRIEDFFNAINNHNKSLHNNKDYVKYYIPKNYEMGWNNIVNEVNEIGINPSIIFFKTNNLLNTNVKKISKFEKKYFTTSFKNLEGYLILPKKDTADKISDINLLFNNTYFKDKLNDISQLFITDKDNKYYGGANVDYDYKKNQLLNYFNNKIKFSSGTKILDNLIIEKHLKEKGKNKYIGYSYYMTLQIIADILYKSVSKVPMGDNKTKCTIQLVWNNSQNFFDCDEQTKTKIIKELLNYLIENKKNNIYYKTSYLGSASQIIRWFFDKEEVNKEIKQDDDTLGKQNLQKLSNFIENIYKIKSYAQEIKKFYETKTINTIFLLNYLYNPKYFRNNSYLYNYSFYKEYQTDESNTYTNVLSINILDKTNQNKYNNILQVQYDNGFNPIVYNKLFNTINGLDCNKLLKDNNIKINKINIKDCQNAKKALSVYLSIEKNLNNIKKFLESKLDNNRVNDIYKMLNNYFYAGQCTWFVKSKKPQITWGGNAKDWCHNALSDKSAKVIYDYNNVHTGDIIVWDWKQYGHVGIVKKVFKDKGKILVNDMNWKGPFIEGEHIMKIKHPNFECYISF